MEMILYILSVIVVRKIVANGCGGLCIQGMSQKRNRKIDDFLNYVVICLYVIFTGCCVEDDLELGGGKKWISIILFYR